MPYLVEDQKMGLDGDVHFDGAWYRVPWSWGENEGTVGSAIGHGGGL